MYQPKVVPSIDVLLEECILESKSEDEAQECMQRFSESMEQMPDPDMSELDVCIVSAKSEDEVQECIANAHFATAIEELAESIARCESVAELELCLADSEWSSSKSVFIVDEASRQAPSRSPMEECIVSAENEDEVKLCLDMEEDEAGAEPEALSSLDECILGAGSEDVMKACLEAEEERVDSFEKLRTALAEKSRAATCDADMEACIRAAEMRLA